MPSGVRRGGTPIDGSGRSRRPFWRARSLRGGCPPTPIRCGVKRPCELSDAGGAWRRPTGAVLPRCEDDVARFTEVEEPGRSVVQQGEDARGTVDGIQVEVRHARPTSGCPGPRS